MGSTRLRQGPQQHRLAGFSLRSTLVGLFLGAGLLAAGPSAASAAVGVSGGVLTYNARAGDANNIGISFNGTDYSVTDSVPIDAAPSGGCIVAGNSATCNGSGVNSIRVNSGNLNDSVIIDASVTKPTQLFGREGNDVLSGGSGNDTLNGYTGDDTLIGNGGVDTADYSSSPPGASVTVDLAGGIATGVGTDRFDPGNLSTIENVRGSPGDDAINSRNNAVSAVSCGGGQDVVLSDAIDVVSSDCEDNNDAVAPTITITAGPSGPTSQQLPAFGFTASDKDPIHFECSISNSADSTATACQSPYQPTANLDEGPHTFLVTAIDKYGNARSASSDFTVDTVAPGTQLDSTPGDVVNTSTPTFTFSSADPGARFLCRFDSGDFFECTSPLVPSPPLSNGTHTFEVAAIDAAGNFDQTPVSFTFTVNAPVSAPGAGKGSTTQAGSSNVIVGSLVLISGRSVKLVKGKLVPVSLTCAGQHLCSGRVSVTTDKPVKKGKRRKRRVERLGSKAFSIPGNTRKKILVPVGKSKVRLLKRLRRVKVRATIREVDLHGHPRISMRTFLLRAR